MLPRTCPSCGSALSKRFLATTTRRQAKAPHAIQSASRTFRIGLIGAGPAGFYAAARLLQKGGDKIKVDMFEELPVPYGLVRFGVAPDHPEVKNCVHKFEETAQDPRFHFYGNVQIKGLTESEDHFPLPNAANNLAASVSLAQLAPHYDAILLTYGASHDRSLGIPGEGELSNVFSARSFVHFYNGHPYADLGPHFDLSKIDKVTIVGQGNVALDCARILLASVDELRQTDTPEHVLALLARSAVRQVNVVGRRGPLQFSGTTKELREMMQLPDVHFRQDEAVLAHAIEILAKHPTSSNARMKKRLLDLMRKGSQADPSASKQWSLLYHHSPFAFHASPIPSTSGALPPVKSIDWRLSELDEQADQDPVDWPARPTDQIVTTETDMVLKSVGYRSVPIAGVPFDQKRGVVINDNGRVHNEQGQRVPGLYVSGWLARGPNGVLTTTMMDAHLTAEIMLDDLAAAAPNAGKAPEPIDIQKLAGSSQVVQWQDWQTIDKEERRRGAALGKEREKILTVKDMLELL